MTKGNKEGIDKKLLRNKLIFRALPAAAIVLAIVIFILQFFTDNKYFRRSPEFENGAVIVSSDNAYALTEGWQIYEGLVYPGEFDSKTPLRENYRIGNESNLTAFGLDANGSVTYRIFIRGNGNISIYLPEVFSCSNIFSNGKQIGSTGDAERGKIYIRDKIYPLELDGETEIVIQVTAGGHYYGGIYYPPLAGNADALSRAIIARLVLYGVAAAFILLCGTFAIPSLIYGLKRKTAISLILLCLFSALSFIYPFATESGISNPVLLYTFTDVFFALALFFAVRLAAQLCGREKGRSYLLFGLPLTSGTALLCAVMPPLMLLIPDFASAYGYIVSAVKIVCGAYLCYLCAAAFADNFKTTSPRLKDFSSSIILAGGLAYSILTIVGTASIGFFEPIVSFWCEETGLLIMSAALGTGVFCNALSAAKVNRILTENLSRAYRRIADINIILENRKKLVKSISHDLKTPVTAVRSYAENLLDSPNTDEKTRRNLSLIYEKLDDFTARYKLLENLEKEDLKPLKPIDLNEYSRSWAESVRDDIEMNGAEFKVEICAEPLTVCADENKLDRILENLVFNAAAFTPEGGEITLSLKKENGCALLVVSDTGSGIPDDLMPRIFEPGVSGRGEYGERGMGLYIVKTLASALNGSVSAYSSLSGGAEFTLSLPLSDKYL